MLAGCAKGPCLLQTTTLTAASGPMTNRMVGAALPSPALKVRGLLVIQAPARLATLVGMLVLLDRRVELLSKARA